MSTPSSTNSDGVDAIDQAAGLTPGSRVHTARRFRATALEHTQASHDALLFDPVVGLSTADRLRVAVQVCEASGAATLAQHYRALLTDPARAADAHCPDPTAQAMTRWALTLTTDPRSGDREALLALKTAGLSDAAVVALAQLVAFLSYQTRVVAGLRALAASPAPSTSL